MTKLEKYLCEKLKYDDYELQIVMEDIKKMDEESLKILESAIDGNNVGNYSEGDYSVQKLMDEKKFNILVAIMCIDNLKKDYKKFDALYKRPIK